MHWVAVEDRSENKTIVSLESIRIEHDSLGPVASFVGKSLS